MIQIIVFADQLLWIQRQQRFQSSVVRCHGLSYDSCVYMYKTNSSAEEVIDMVSIRPYFPSPPLECLGMRLACVLSGCTYSCTVHIHSYMYHSVVGVFKHSSWCWPTWALTVYTQDQKVHYYVCIEAITVAPWNAVHGRIPGSGSLPGTQSNLLLSVTICGSPRLNGTR